MRRKSTTSGYSAIPGEKPFSPSSLLRKYGATRGNKNALKRAASPAAANAAPHEIEGSSSANPAIPMCSAFRAASARVSVMKRVAPGRGRGGGGERGRGAAGPDAGGA